MMIYKTVCRNTNMNFRGTFVCLKDAVDRIKTVTANYGLQSDIGKWRKNTINNCECAYIYVWSRVPGELGKYIVGSIYREYTED